MLKVQKVMILEDAQTDQALIKRQVLKYNPRSVFTVASNKTGFLEKINWYLPDLILVDFQLPDYNGLEAIIHIKENKPFVPVMFVTGGLNPHDSLAEIILNVADGFILKDDLSNLHIRIKEIMTKNKAKGVKHAQMENEKRHQKIKILKAVNLLNNSECFSGKEELIGLIKSMDADWHEEE